MAKSIAVFGATGRQGGSVVRALLKDNQYVVRAVTRNPDSEAAKKLKQQGCEVVFGDFDNKDSLVEATKGAHGVFLVTNFWETLSGEAEERQGKAAVDACKQNDVKHLVFSGLQHCKKETGLSVPHFDSKAEIEDYIIEQKIPYTMIRVPSYMENLFDVMAPQKKEDGTFSLDIPMGDVPMDFFPVERTGEPVRSIFNQPQEYQGKKIGLISAKHTLAEIAELLTKHCKPAVVKDGRITLDAYRALPFPLAMELGNMYECVQRGIFSRDPELSRTLDPGAPDLEEWIIANKDRLRKQLGSDDEFGIK